MKKLFLIFNVMLIFLLTTIGRVKAYEEPVGFFFGKEYPIIYNDPNVMPLYDVNGYSVQSYYVNDSGKNVSFNQAVTLPNTNQRRFIFTITLPEDIAKYENFTFSMSGTLNNGVISSPTLNGFASNYTSVTVNGVSLLKTGTNYFYSVYTGDDDDCVANGTTKFIEVYMYIKPATTSFSFIVDSITISKVSTDGLVASIASVLAELVPYIMNIDENIDSILTFMQPILNAINSGTSSIVSAINSMSGSVVSAINSMSNAIQSDLNTINSSINSMNTNLGSKIDSMKTTLNNAIVTMMNTLNNSLNNLLGENEDTTNATNENDSTTSNFENVSGQYDDIEHSAVEDFENNLANVDTDTDLLNVADFKSTSNFIATNLTNIYNSHDYIGNMIIFSLVIGFSLTLIGIKVRR